MPKKIIVECKPDEKLARAIGFTRVEVAHQSNKGEVCNHLMKSDILLALIDEDPNSSQPKHLNSFSLIEERFGVKKLRLQNKNKTILVLKPRLEEWILSRCSESNISPETFHLSSNNKRLKDEINNKLVHFESLLNALIINNDAGLRYLIEQSSIATA